MLGLSKKRHHAPVMRATRVKAFGDSLTLDEFRTLSRRVPPHFVEVMAARDISLIFGPDKFKELRRLAQHLERTADEMERTFNALD